MEAAAPVSGFAWPGLPYPALITSAGIAGFTILVLAAAYYLDATGGILTLSIIIVLAFVAVTLMSMIYQVPQTPLTEILVGSLATSMGGIVTYWMRKADDSTGHQRAAAENDREQK